MRKLKIGDKVKRLESNNSGFLIGQIGVVTYISSSGDCVDVDAKYRNNLIKYLKLIVPKYTFFQ